MLGRFRKSRPGAEATTSTPAPAAVPARPLTVLTVLLADAPGEPATLADLLARAGFGDGAAALPVGLEPTLHEAPCPDGGLDRRFAPGLTELGSRHLALALPSGPRRQGSADGATPDPWGAEGGLRAATLLAARLLQQGAATGVVVHAAGEVLFARDAWLARAGDAAHPDARPIGAWIDLAMEGDLVASRGMEAMDLPDVAVRPARFGEGAEGLQRAQEAVLYACKRMVEENRPIRPGDEVRVPIGVVVGDLPLERRNPGMELASAPRLRAVGIPERVLLDPLDPARSLGARWAEAAGRTLGPLPYPAYRELLLSRLRADGWREIASMGFDDLPAAVPLHEVFVYQIPAGAFVTLTCGIGRIAQPNGRAADRTDHVELCAVLPRHHPAIARTLSMLGRAVHGRGPGAPPLGVGHRLRLAAPIPPLGVETVAFGWCGEVRPEAGPAITLLAPVIMTAEERDSVDAAALGRWIQERGGSAEVASRWLGAAAAPPA